MGYTTSPKVRDQLVRTARGVLSENAYPGLSSTGSAPTAGTAYMGLVGVCAGDVISKVGFYVNTAGSGTVPTKIVAGIADSTGKILAVTAELKNDAQWTAAGAAEVRFALSSAYTVPANGVVYVCFLQVGSWGTTQMSLSRSGSNQFIPFSGALVLYGTGGTGLSDLPSVGSSLTPSGASGTGPAYYFQVS